MRFGGAGRGAREGEPSVERVCSREGREEVVGVEIWGMRRPFTEVSRGLAMVDILVAGADMLLSRMHWGVVGVGFVLM